VVVPEVGQAFGKCPAPEQDAMALCTNASRLNLVLLPGLAFQSRRDGVMRGFVLAALCAISSGVIAEGMFLIPAENPKPKYPKALYRAGIFRYTRSYLSHSFASSQLSNDKRLALIAKLNESIPSIIRRCNTHSSTRYVHFLPEEIRKLL
jgi:hypothetical protein